MYKVRPIGDAWAAARRGTWLISTQQDFGSGGGRAFDSGKVGLGSYRLGIGLDGKRKSLVASLEFLSESFVCGYTSLVPLGFVHNPACARRRQPSFASSPHGLESTRHSPSQVPSSKQQQKVNVHTNYAPRVTRLILQSFCFCCFHCRSAGFNNLVSVSLAISARDTIGLVDSILLFLLRLRSSTRHGGGAKKGGSRR